MVRVRWVLTFLAGAVSMLLLAIWWVGTGAPTTAESVLTPTPTICPAATPEYLGVEPLRSPPSAFSQTVFVAIGNGDAVTVTLQSGTFTQRGDFNAFSSPAAVNIGLLPNTRHELLVEAHVREIYQNGCRYGGYTLSTRYDRLGQPLIIEQVMAAADAYLPVVAVRR